MATQLKVLSLKKEESVAQIEVAVRRRISYLSLFLVHDRVEALERGSLNQELRESVTSEEEVLLELRDEIEDLKLDVSRLERKKAGE